MPSTHSATCPSFGRRREREIRGNVPITRRPTRWETSSGTLSRSRRYSKSTTVPPPSTRPASAARPESIVRNRSSLPSGTLASSINSTRFGMLTSISVALSCTPIWSVTFMSCSISCLRDIRSALAAPRAFTSVATRSKSFVVCSSCWERISRRIRKTMGLSAAAPVRRVDESMASWATICGRRSSLRSSSRLTIASCIASSRLTAGSLPPRALRPV